MVNILETNPHNSNSNGEGINILNESNSSVYQLETNLKKQIAFLDSLNLKLFSDKEREIIEKLKIDIKKLKNKIGKGYSDKLLEKGIKEDLYKIDTIFQTKIKAILDVDSKNEKSEDKKSVESTATKATIANTPATGRGSVTIAGSYGPSSSTVAEIAPVASGESDDVEKKESVGKIEGITVEDLELMKAYLEFKGEKKSNIYKVLNDTIIKNVRQHPALLAKPKYQKFIKTYILDSIIDKKFDITNKNYQEDLKKLKENTQTELNKFQKQIPNKSVKEEFIGSIGLEMDEAREKIQELQKMSFNELVENKKSFLNIKFKGIRPDIKQGLESFKANSANTNNKLSDLITNDNIDKLAQELSDTKNLFNDLKNELSYIYDYLDSNPKLIIEERENIEKDIKSIVGLMYFINGLNYSEFTKLKNYSIITHIINYTINKGPILGIITLSVFAMIILKRHYDKYKNSSKFFNTLDKNLPEDKKGKFESKKEGLDKISTLKKSINHLNTSDKIKELIDEMTDKDGILKEEYEEIKDIYSRLKKLYKLKVILKSFKKFDGIKINNNVVFLNHKAFARDILIKIFSKGKVGTGYKWLSKMARGYSGTGFFGGILDLMDNGKGLGFFGRTETFGEKKATKILDSFIEKYGEIAIFSEKLKLTKNDLTIDEKTRKKIDKTVDNITERLINKNVILSEILVKSFKYSDEEDKNKKIKEIKDFLESKPFLKEFRLGIKVKESGITYKGIIDKAYHKSKLVWELIKNKFSTELKGGDGSIKNIGKTEINEIFKAADIEYENINNDLKTDGKIDPKKVQKYMLDELNSKLHTNIELTTINNKSYQERMKEAGKTNETEELKTLKETIRTENIKLGEFMFTELIFDKLKTKGKLEKIQDIINNIKEVIDIKGGLGVFESTINGILEFNKGNIETNINNNEIFEIDSRIKEMVGENGEIKNIKEIIKKINKFDGKEWLTNEFKNKLIEKINTGLKTIDPTENKINTILEKFKELENIKVKDIYKFEGKKKVVDEEATEEKLDKKINEKINEFRRILDLDIEEYSEPKTGTKTGEKPEEPQSPEAENTSKEEKEFEKLKKIRESLIYRMKLQYIIDGKKPSDVSTKFEGLYGEDLKNFIELNDSDYSSIEDILKDENNIKKLKSAKASTINIFRKLHGKTINALIKRLGEKSEGGKFLDDIVKEIKKGKI